MYFRAPGTKRNTLRESSASNSFIYIPHSVVNTGGSSHEQRPWLLPRSRSNSPGLVIETYSNPSRWRCRTLYPALPVLRGFIVCLRSSSILEPYFCRRKSTDRPIQNVTQRAGSAPDESLTISRNIGTPHLFSRWYGLQNRLKNALNVAVFKMAFVVPPPAPGGRS